MILYIFVAFLTFGNVLSLCPRGWKQHGYACYHVNHEPASWIDGMRTCELHNGRLADITSQFEQSFLHDYLRTHFQPADYWVGGTDWENEGEWIWEGTGMNVTYKHWLPGQPNNGRAPLANPTSGNAEYQNCLSLRYQDNFRWVDSVCAEHLHYICEIPATVPGNTTTILGKK